MFIQANQQHQISIFMNITFENILEKVVNNRSISRKDKQNAIRDFLKKNSGDNKPKSQDELTTLETLKAINKAFAQKDASEKLVERKN
jgi:hypothetical protein